MYKRNGIKKLGRTKSHRDSLIKNQIRSLLRSGSIKTTTPKAKVLRQKANKFISKASKLVDNKVLYNRTVEEYLGKGLAKENLSKVLSSKDHSISLVKIGFRDGDNAEVTRVLVPALMEAKKKVTKSADKADKKASDKKTDSDDSKSNSNDSGKSFVKTTKRTTKEVDTKGHKTKIRARSRSGL